MISRKVERQKFFLVKYAPITSVLYLNMFFCLEPFKMTEVTSLFEVPYKGTIYAIWSVLDQSVFVA